MSLKQKIQDNIKTALREHDTDTLSTLRMAWSAIRQVEIDERIDADDQRVIEILTKMVKQRKEAVQTYESCQRHDLAEKEQNEILVLQHYLPKLMDEAEIETVVQAVIHDIKATKISDIGKVMGVLKNQLAGKADMSVVSKKVKQLLSAS